MATSTSNYRLTKPSPEDFYDIEVQNENLEVIDGKLKELETGVDQVREGFEGHLGDYVRNAGFGVTGGTLSAYTLTLNPSPNSYADGQQFTILPHVDCGANPKLNINGLGALTILKQDGSAVEAGEIKANKPLALVRVGSSFFMRSGGGAYIIPLYSGVSSLRIDSATKGQIVCSSSGNIVWHKGKRPALVDVFVLGGGGAGGGTYAYNASGGSGGGGGYYTKALGIPTTESISIITGGGGASDGGVGGQSSALGISANGGGGGVSSMSVQDRRPGGTGSANGGYSGATGEATGGPGENGVATDFDGYTHAAGGGGGAGYNNTGGGAGGSTTNPYNRGRGNNAGVNGYTDTELGGKGGSGFGGGGGGAAAINGNQTKGGNGGSGVVIIRWGY